MADRTSIEWTDATVNAVNGCSVCSPGCTNCYAMRLAGTRMKNHPTRAGLTQDSKAGPVWTGEVRLHEGALLQPLRWTRPRRIFWNAHGDLFHPAVPDEWIDMVFAVCALTPQHQHQILTKRPERMREYLTSGWQPRLFPWLAKWSVRPAGHGVMLETVGGVLPNVWLGTSVEDQTRADERIPHLLATPAAVRFLSIEPLLGAVRLDRIHQTFDDGLGHSWESCLNGKRFSELGGPDGNGGDIDGCPRIDWVIVGGESGPGSRPMHADWVRSIRDQCQAAGVPLFFKQWGDWLPEGQFDSTGFQWAPGQDGRVHWWIEQPPHGAHLRDSACSIRIGKKQAGNRLDRAVFAQLPVVLP